MSQVTLKVNIALSLAEFYANEPQVRALLFRAQNCACSRNAIVLNADSASAATAHLNL